MKTIASPPVCTGDHVEREIPWYVNGTADPAERQRVQQHLELCADCRRSLELEMRFVASTREQHETLECAPQSGWRRLAARLDAESAMVPETTKQGARPSRSQSAGRVERWRLAISPKALSAVLLAQAAAIVALALALSHFSTDREGARYRTLTSPGVSISSDAPMLRVVFAAETSSARIGELLGQIEGTIRAGPTKQNVYTVELASSPKGALTASQAAEWLREHPEVLFAVPIGRPGDEATAKSGDGA